MSIDGLMGNWNYALTVKYQLPQKSKSKSCNMWQYGWTWGHFSKLNKSKHQILYNSTYLRYLK